MQLPSLNALVATTKETILRFPLVLLSALVGAGLCWLALDDVDAINPGFVFAAALGLPLFMGIDLLSERIERNSYRIVLSLLALAGLVVYAIVVGEKPEHDVTEIYRFGLFVLVAHLFVSVAPFLRGGSARAFWEFNKTLFLRILLSALFSAVLFGGLAVAFLAVDQLLLGGDVIEPEAYGKLFIMVAALFNTIFFLAGVPRNSVFLEEEREYPKGLRIFAQNLLLPLVVLYMSILYIYSVTILIRWEWPEGWIGWLVLSFSVLGILALLLLYPLQERGEVGWINRFSRWFYLAVFPLIGLLFAAIIRRVSEYGITENRYFVLLLACWLGGIAIYFTISRRKNIKIIPISLGAVALLSAFGPWSAFSVSTGSQARRFEEVARKNNLLVGEKIDSAKGSRLKDEEKSELNSILQYLDERDDLDELAGLLPKEVAARNSSMDIASYIGIGWDGSIGIMKSGQSSFSFNSAIEPFNQTGIDIGGFDLLFFNGNYSYTGVNERPEGGYDSVSTATYNGETYRILFRPTDPELLVVAKGDTLLRFRLDSLMAAEIQAWSAEHSDYHNQQHADHIDPPDISASSWHMFSLDAAGDSLKGRLIIRFAVGYYNNDAQGKVIPKEIGVSSLDFLLLLGKKE